MTLIVGGTGNLGGHIVEHLLSPGNKVRAMTRDPSRARKLQDAGVQVVQGDLRDSQSLVETTRDVRVVISASHAMLGTRSNASRKIDDAGQHQLIHAAEDNAVEQFLYVSVMGASASHALDFWRTKARIVAESIHVPMLVPRILSGVTRPIHEGVQRLMRTISTAPSRGMTLDPAPFLQRYPMTLMRLEEWARAYS